MNHKLYLNSGSLLISKVANSIALSLVVATNWMSEIQ